MFYQREDIFVIGQFNYFNLLAPARYGSKFKNKIFKLMIENSSLSSRCEMALGRMPQDLTNEWLK